MGYSPWGHKESETTEATGHGTWHMVELQDYTGFRCTTRDSPFLQTVPHVLEKG